MALTSKEVEHVALLARLSLTEEEKLLFSKQLTLILDYADKLNEVPTDNVEPLTHILPVYNIFKPDEMGSGTSREEMLANSQGVEDNHYKVPKII